MTFSRAAQDNSGSADRWICPNRWVRSRQDLTCARSKEIPLRLPAGRSLCRTDNPEQWRVHDENGKSAFTATADVMHRCRGRRERLLAGRQFPVGGTIHAGAVVLAGRDTYQTSCTRPYFMPIFFSSQPFQSFAISAFTAAARAGLSLCMPNTTWPRPVSNGKSELLSVKALKRSFHCGLREIAYCITGGSPMTASSRPASRSRTAASEVSYSDRCRPVILRSSGMNEKPVIVPTRFFSRSFSLFQWSSATA
jgi:hypothetical protein